MDKSSSKNYYSNRIPSLEIADVLSTLASPTDCMFANPSSLPDGDKVDKWLKLSPHEEASDRFNGLE